MSTPSHPVIRLQILSRPDLLAPVRSMVLSLSERFGFDEVESGHLALATDEALANVIRHGYDSRPDGRIWISFHLIDHPEPCFRIEIEDEGKQVDPESIAPRRLEDVRPGGLGVHIMREITDTCDFEPRNPGGMRVILEKSPGKGQDAPKPESSNSPDEAGPKPDQSQ
ncbi:MAG: hypothetical protein CMJ23_05875 [Phycisphaerae bacterium]|nr:hypothetical protein [Phycisphaerae bacterium]